MKFEIEDLIKIVIFPFIVFIFSYTLAIFNVYDFYLWLNRFAHFLGGLGMAISGYYILNLAKRAGYLKINRILIDAALIVFFVMTAAVVWEFYEYLSDVYLFTHSQPNVADVIKDQFMGMLGAVFFAIGLLVSKISLIRRPSVQIQAEKIKIKTAVK
ncbi:MAG: hypothetical protein AAB348_01045 [Patescibacteria group bacterium]